MWLNIPSLPLTLAVDRLGIESGAILKNSLIANPRHGCLEVEKKSTTPYSPKRELAKVPEKLKVLFLSLSPIFLQLFWTLTRTKGE
jgi:hypothetical protein